MQINVSYHIMNNNSSVYGFLVKRHLSVYHEQEPYNHMFAVIIYFKYWAGVLGHAIIFHAV